MTTGIRRRWISIAVIMLAALTLAACGGPPPAASWSGLTVSGQTAYLAATDRIYAIDTNVKTPNASRLLWSFPPLEQGARVTFHSQPAVSENGDVLFAGSDSAAGSSAVFALDTQLLVDAGEPPNTKKTASIVWAYPAGENPPPLGSIYGGVAYDGKSIYAGTSDGQVISIGAQTGQVNWVFTATQRIWSSPVVSGSVVYVASQNHSLYALRASDGSKLWTFQSNALMPGTPAVYGDTVYAGSLDNQVYAIQADAGTQKWAFDAQGWVWDGPILFDNILYFGTLNGDFYALSRAGTPVWEQPLKLEGGIRAQPLVTQDVIYVATQARKLYAIERASRAIKWTFTALQDGEQLLTTPVLAGESLLVAPMSAGGSPTRLYAVDAQSGNLQWQYPAPEVKP